MKIQNQKTVNLFLIVIFFGYSKIILVYTVNVLEDVKTPRVYYSMKLKKKKKTGTIYAIK